MTLVLDIFIVSTSQKIQNGQIKMFRRQRHTSQSLTNKSTLTQLKSGTTVGPLQMTNLAPLTRRTISVGQCLPVIMDDILYITELVVIHCLDANSGELYWTENMFANTWSSPCVADGIGKR